jgi:hypothetical protein
MFKENDKVFWKWMGNKIYGKVIEVYQCPVTKEIKGKFIKRNGSDEKPAYYVQSEAGNFALKLQTELFRVSEDDEE